MSVTSQDIKEIHQKIDDHRKEIRDDIAKPMNELTIEIGKLVSSFTLHQKTSDRLELNQISQGQDIVELRKDYSDLRLDTLVAIKELSTNQKGMLAIASRAAVPLLVAMQGVAGILIYFKYMA